MTILRTLLAAARSTTLGEFYDLTLDAPRIAVDRAAARQMAGRLVTPPFYFGGLSEPARDVATQAADLYLMWPDTMPEIAAIIADMRARAGRHGRSLRFGYRTQIVVRETERAAANRLLSKLDAAEGEAIRNRSLDATSAGVSRQAELSDTSDDDGFIEEHLWTGIARARSGCGAAIVGDPDQLVAKSRAYMALGIDTFILPGYPHLAECDLAERHVLPAL